MNFPTENGPNPIEYYETERLKPARLTPFLKTSDIVITVAEIIRPNARIVDILPLIRCSGEPMERCPCLKKGLCSAYPLPRSRVEVRKEVIPMFDSLAAKVATKWVAVWSTALIGLQKPRLIVLLVGLFVAVSAATAQQSKDTTAPKSSAAQQRADQAHATLGSNVTFTVVATRTWSPPDVKFLLRDKVPDDSYYYLQMDGLSTGGGPSVVVENEGAEDIKTVLRTRAVFKRRCVKLSPPKGEYLEVLLMFQNATKQTADEPISGVRRPGS